MSSSLLQSALIIIVVTMVGRVMGLVRSVFISHEFGTSYEVGAFYAAFTVPSTLFLFLPGAMNAIFIPSLKGLVALGKREEARALFRKMFTVTTLLYLVITVLGMIFAEPIISVMTPGIPGNEKELAAQLLRWMLPSNLFIVLIGLFSSTLNVHDQFGLPNLGTIVNSLIVILSIFTLVPFYGIHGLAIGTTLGFAGAALIMLPSILGNHYSLAPDWKWNDPELKRIGERFIPIMLGSIITSMNEFIEKFLVSDFGSDKIAALSYAKQIYQVPMAVFVGAFAMPIFPLLVEFIKKGEMQPAKEAIEKGLLYMMLLMVPTTAGLWLLGKGIVSVLFQRGEFDAYSTQITAYGLVFFALGLYPLAVRDILTRAFYALENTRIPVIVSVIQILAYIAASLTLSPYLGFAGAALGWSVGALVNALLLGAILWRKIGRFIGWSFGASAAKILLASLGMAGILFLYNLAASGWNRYVHVFLGIAVGALAYAALLLAVKERLALDLFSKVVHRIKQPSGKRKGLLP